MMKTMLSVASIFVAIGLSNSARAMNSRIACTYLTGTGSLQTATFDGPKEIDLKNPNPSLKEVPLRVNGEKIPTVFSVQQTTLIAGSMTKYHYRDPLFASGITLTYIRNYFQGDSFNGYWSDDVPPGTSLDCRFETPDSGQN